MTYDLTVTVTLKGGWNTARQKSDSRKEELEVLASSIRQALDEELAERYWSRFAVTSSEVTYTASPRR